MLVSIEQQPDSAKIWIYQAERLLTENEVKYISKTATPFLKQWQAHGKDLIAAFEVKHHQFLVLSVDEVQQQATGCSIDASVHLVKQLEQKLNVSFSNNGLVAFQKGEEIKLMPFNKIKEAILSNEITKDTSVFDNTVQRMGDYRKRWQVLAKNTWLQRYLI